MDTHALAPQDTAAQTWGNWLNWGDLGDGTFRNPVLPADYSDIDCIRVGSDYYAISSTFQYSPGMIVLHSRDLVNWTIVGHVTDDLTRIGPELNWDKMDRYGRGIWAGAIRHHAGKFWAYFGTPDEGYFMSTAERPEGPWTPLHALMREPGWDDCCPFWDDDGQGYFVGTHFKDGYKTYLFKLTEDGRELVPESKLLINEGLHREANKLFKKDGWYYHFFSEHVHGIGRYVMMQRARSITGPYSERRQLAHAQREFREPNQGGIVQTEAGDWWFFTHHGTGEWEGRCASLLPVTWVDDWPVIGAVGGDGLGTMVWQTRKPLQAGPPQVPQTDDDFNATALGVQWEWNYQPRPGFWSLAERPGWLRLRAFKPLRPDDLRSAGNTLTQRVFRARANTATARFDVSGLTDGQVAGLTLFGRSPGTIAVRRAGEVVSLEMTTGAQRTTGAVLDASTVDFRAEWGLDGLARFSFSTDGERFTPLGGEHRMTWADYRGTRLGLFTYNNEGEAGHVDIDTFTYRADTPVTRAPSR